MIVPSPQNFSTIPVAGVFVDTSNNWYLKCNDNTGVNLATGTNTGPIPPANEYTYYPTATLSV